MDLRQLEMFRAVAETSSFTRAGEKLHVSHSAISRQVKLLEDELRVLLFARANKRVTLTEPGTALLTHVEAIFNQVAMATQSDSQMSTKVNRQLNLGTATTMLDFFLPPVFEEFKRKYPRVDVHIKTGPWQLLLEAIRAGTIDLIIGSVPTPFLGRDLVVCPLYREELVLVAGNNHPLTRKTTIRPDELTHFSLLTYPSYSTTRQILESIFHRLKISPNILLELENDEAIVNCVSEGVGIAFLPMSRAIQKKLHFVRIADTPIFRTVGLVTLLARQAEAHLAYFLTLCAGHAQYTNASDVRVGRSDVPSENICRRQVFGRPPELRS
jgi:DNA-binding transcriptional LysR family regulator